MISRSSATPSQSAATKKQITSSGDCISTTCFTSSFHSSSSPACSPTTRQSRRRKNRPSPTQPSPTPPATILRTSPSGTSCCPLEASSIWSTSASSGGSLRSKRTRNIPDRSTAGCCRSDRSQLSASSQPLAQSMATDIPSSTTSEQSSSSSCSSYLQSPSHSSSGTSTNGIQPQSRDKATF